MRSLLLLPLLVACTAEVGEPPVLSEVEQHTAVCADGPTTYGIDVSRYQGSIDWQKVADADVKFAYIQISRSLTDVDAKFDYNWRRAKEVGILRGAYQRFQPDQDVIGQANLFLQKLGPYEAGDLPPLLDVEDDGGLGPTVIAQRVRQWVDHVELAIGLRPIIYTGYYFWRDKVGGADFSSHLLWIANYSATCPLVPERWTRWAFHQYSSTAMVPGITENTVDVNKFNGTLAELQALGKLPVCGDGTCNGIEDADSCPVECAPCQTIAATADGVDDSIVDDTSACFRGGGDPRFLRSEGAGHGSSLRWTHTTDAATPSSYGVWNLHFGEAGRYRVEAFTPAPFNDSRQARYRIRHASVTTDVVIDQQVVDGWNLIAEVDFAAGGAGQSVRLDDNTGEPNAGDVQLVFDALRFTRLDGAGPGEMSGDSGGCAAGQDVGGVSLLALGLLARRCRRRSRERSKRSD